MEEYFKSECGIKISELNKVDYHLIKDIIIVLTEFT